MPDKSNRICLVVEALSWNVVPFAVLQRMFVLLSSVLLLTFAVLLAVSRVPVPGGMEMESPEPIPAQLNDPTFPVPLSFRGMESTKPEESMTTAPPESVMDAKVAAPALSMLATTAPRLKSPVPENTFSPRTEANPDG